MIRVGPLAFALAALCACGDDPAVVVDIDTRVTVRDLSYLSIQVSDASESIRNRFDLDDSEFPKSLTIATDGRGGEMTVDVTGYDANDVERAHGVATVVLGSAGELSLMLDPAEFGVNARIDGFQTLTRDLQFAGRQISVADDGTFVVVWEDAVPQIRLFDERALPKSNGVAMNDLEFDVAQYPGDPGRDDHVAIAHSNGVYLAAWETGVGMNFWPRDVFVRAFRASDAAPATNFPEVPVSTSMSESSEMPSVVPLADGNFAVVWIRVDPTEFGQGDARVRLVGPDGMPLPGDARASSKSNGDLHSRPAGAGLTGGGFVLVWEEDVPNGFETDVVARLFTAAAGARTADITIAAGNVDQAMRLPYAAALADGGFAIAWVVDSIFGLGSVLQLFDSQGAATSTQIGIGELEDFDEHAVVAVRGDGAIGVTWFVGNGLGENFDVYFRLFHPNGMPCGDAEIVSNVTQASQSAASIAAFGDDAFLVTWTDASELAGDTDLEGIEARAIYPRLDRTDGTIGSTCDPDMDTCGDDLQCVDVAAGSLCHETCPVNGVDCDNGGVCSDGVCVY
jgi:hypothetical protein